MPASVWKGSIVLSFVSIPVTLFAAARSERTYLHQLHTVCHTRLRQPLFCPTCERFVKRDEVIKGYEVDEGQYVLVEGEEIKKLAAKSSRMLEVLAFTKLNQIDPIFFDASYFCVPDETGKKPYQLLVKALEDTQSIGLGRLTMHQRDYTVFLRAYQHGLLLHTMYFANEIRRVPEFGALEAANLKQQEIKLTEQLIATMKQPFKPAQYHDEFQDRLRKLVEAKRRGQTVEVEEAAKRAPVIDMMEALKKSLASRAKSEAETKKLPAKHRKAAVKVKKAS
jgi:DNA end-binding protein Ku